MRTIKVKLLHEEPGFCLAVFKEIGKNKYYNRHHHFDGWYTATKDYFESDTRVKDDVVFEIMDYNGNLLFTDSNSEPVWFLLTADKAKEYSAKFVSELSLKSYDEWKEWLLKEYGTYSDAGSRDNWLYGHLNHISYEEIDRYEYLGVKFTVFNERESHVFCGKEWRSVYIKDEYGYCAAICGYLFDEEIQGGNL